MNEETLRLRLRNILLHEERSKTDWKTVESLCEQLRQDLANQTSSVCPHIVLHFLSDADLRAKDADYAQGQRIEIRRFVETGECTDSKPFPAWGCLAVIIAIAAPLFWYLS